MPPVVKLAPAVWDLIEIADYLAGQSPAVAERFLDAAEQTFDRLASMPGMGELFPTRDPRLACVRRHPVARFRRHIIYYRPLPEGIEVLRVIHGARNVRDILSGGV